MITRKPILFALTAAASLYAFQGISCSANDNSQSVGTVGAASVSASGLSLKANLERQFDNLNVKTRKSSQKAQPEPVCNDHKDLDKTLILGGSEVIPM
ncbi:MAG TPA: hypothetical protein V6C97_03005 [Oculatellaceae cyanobacterium]